MSKYMAFGWSEKADKKGPADELLGTCDTIDYEGQEYKQLPGGGVQFGLKLESDWVDLAPNLMRGRRFLMEVLYTYDRLSKSPVVAYYLIPRTGTKNG